MKRYGLCGGSGSGKTEVAFRFNCRGIPSVNADKVYHALTEKKSACLDAIVDAFGSDVLLPEGGLDRPKLASVVFSGDNAEEKRLKLNAITHPYVEEEICRCLHSFEICGVAFAIIDAPLLFEAGMDRNLDGIISVIAPPEVRIRRIVKRDGISEESARARIATQIPDEELIRKSDFVIYNDGPTGDLYRKVDDLYFTLSEINKEEYKKYL